MNLNEITGPQILKQLSVDEIYKLAEQIRERIINVTSVNGGHVAPSLGVVELTLALHKVFNSPHDKLIWDVGHQSYAHKLITGRAKNFHTLRTHNGISGYPKRSESLHDILETGHSSTSISAACGIAIARDLNDEDFYVISVIGDGALTGGMAFEALEHCGHEKLKKFIVVLNDNGMSISQNVGAMSRYLHKIRIDPWYYKLKEEAEHVFNQIPRIGKGLVKFIERARRKLRYVFIPGLWFEEMGFNYIGPIDGHDIELLLKTFEKAKRLKNEPVVIHIITRKGKGYIHAELNPTMFHGISPFDKVNGKTHKKSKSYSEVMANKLVSIAGNNEKVIAITAAMPDGTGLTVFKNKFPERFFDVGICEQHAVTFAAGLALMGYMPVCTIYSTFLQRAYDQIVHDVCLQNLHVVFAIDRAGIVGEDGPTHHGVFDFSYLSHIPNMTILAPKDAAELEDMLEFAIFKHNGPVALRYPRASAYSYPTKKDVREEILYQRGEMVKYGTDIAILSAGTIFSDALVVANDLETQGFSVALFNARFIKPLDEVSILHLAKKCKFIVTVEDNALIGGFGSMVNTLLLRNGVLKKVLNIGWPDRFIEAGKILELKATYQLNAEGILLRILNYLRENEVAVTKRKLKKLKFKRKSK